MSQSLRTFSRILFQRLAHRRLIHLSPVVTKDQKFPHGTLEQDHALEKSHSARDTQAESVKAGLERRLEGKGAAAMDAAPHSSQPKVQSGSTRGNPEGVGFAEQVGSASSTADMFSSGGRQGVGGSKAKGCVTKSAEGAYSASSLSSLKRALGIKTQDGDDRQSHAVTGTGTSGGEARKQQIHTSAISAAQHGYRRIVEKDVPNPTACMTNIAHELTESRLPLNRRRNHNLSHRYRELSGEAGRSRTDREENIDPVLLRGTPVSPPKERPGGNVSKPNEHASGEWSTAGFGDKPYRNVGVDEEPYEPPADDEEDHSKVDARHKKLRYGGLAKDPKLV